MDPIVERFPRAPIFDGLAPDEISRFITPAENIEFTTGGTVIEEGQLGGGLYVIGAGVFEVRKSVGGKSQTIARLEEMSTFGEMSLFDESVRSASVVCIRDGRLKRTTRERFQQLLDSEDPVAHKITLNICRLLARRLAAVGDLLVS